jgi:hypothetical protein
LRAVELIADEDRVVLKLSRMGHMDGIHSRLWQGMDLLLPDWIAVVHGSILEVVGLLLSLRSLLDLGSGVVERRRTTLSLKLGRDASLRRALPMIVVFVLVGIEFIVRLRAWTAEFYRSVRSECYKGLPEGYPAPRLLTSILLETLRPSPISPGRESRFRFEKFAERGSSRVEVVKCPLLCNCGVRD